MRIGFEGGSCSARFRMTGTRTKARPSLRRPTRPGKARRRSAPLAGAESSGWFSGWRARRSPSATSAPTEDTRADAFSDDEAAPETARNRLQTTPETAPETAPPRRILVSVQMSVDPKIDFVPAALANFVTRTVIYTMWCMLLRVAEGVRDGARPAHAEAIAAKKRRFTTGREPGRGTWCGESSPSDERDEARRTRKRRLTSLTTVRERSERRATGGVRVVIRESSCHHPRTLSPRAARTRGESASVPAVPPFRSTAARFRVGATAGARNAKRTKSETTSAIPVQMWRNAKAYSGRNKWPRWPEPRVRAAGETRPRAVRLEAPRAAIEKAHCGACVRIRGRARTWNTSVYREPCADSSVDARCGNLDTPRIMGGDAKRRKTAPPRGRRDGRDGEGDGRQPRFRRRRRVHVERGAGGTGRSVSRRRAGRRRRRTP